MYRVQDEEEDKSGNGNDLGGGGAVCTLPKLTSVKADMKLLSEPLRRCCRLCPLLLLLMDALAIVPVVLVAPRPGGLPGTRGGRNGVRDEYDMLSGGGTRV